MTNGRSRRRKQAESRGRRAEYFAALALQLKGYRILGYRVKTPVGEIDLIARRGDILAFVEVKQRANLTRALEAVPERNWQRISRAAEAWSARQKQNISLQWRYDLIAIAPGRWPVHKRDYWRP